MSEICVKDYAEDKLDEPVYSDVIAARTTKNWKEFVAADRENKTRRILLVAKAIDALEDVPV